MQKNVTMKTGQSWPLTGQTGSRQVDENNLPLTIPDPTYSGPTYTIDRPDIIATQQNPPAIVALGVQGVATLSSIETSSDTTKAPLNGSVVFTVTGPTPASLEITGGPVQ